MLYSIYKKEVIQFSTHSRGGDHTRTLTLAVGTIESHVRSFLPHLAIYKLQQTNKDDFLEKKSVVLFTLSNFLPVNEPK